LRAQNLDRLKMFTYMILSRKQGFMSVFAQVPL
jgi:hypothetical protein